MKKCAFFIVATVFFTSCIDHPNLYDPEKVKENAKANFPVKDIDPNQNWATRGARTLDVTVNEEQGQVYTIKVFTANPFQEEENPRLLAQSEVENGRKLSLKFDASLALDYVYVMCKAGEKDYVVRAVPLVDDRFVASFGNEPRTRTVSLSGGIEVDKSLTELPADANPNCVTEAGPGYVYTGAVPGNYHLKDVVLWQGITLGNGQHLYITGTVKVPNIKMHEPNASISILPGGNLIFSDQFGAGGGPSLSVASNAIFYNAGTFDNAQTPTVVSGQAKWLNEGTYKGGTFLVQQDAVAQNNCKLDIQELKLIKGSFNNGGYVKGTILTLIDNAKLNLSGKSVLAVSGDATLGVGTITAPSGDTKPYPFLSAASFKMYGQAPSVNNNIYTSAGGDGAIVSKFKVIKATIGALPDGECVPPVKVEEDETGNTSTSGCTIGFEDVRLMFSTDYDFNDVVLWVSNPIKNQSKVYLVATGATNRIQVGYRDASGNHDLWDGKEIHELLNIPSGTMFNTMGDMITENLPSVTLTVPNGVTTLDNFDFYIRVNGDDNNLIFSKNTELGDVPFGLCVSEDWNFPVEGKRIDQVYAGFGEWGANKETNKTWYKDGTAGLTRQFNSALLK